MCVVCVCVCVCVRKAGGGGVGVAVQCPMCVCVCVCARCPWSAISFRIAIDQWIKWMCQCAPMCKSFINLHKHSIHRDFKIKAQTLTLSLHVFMSTYSSNYSGYSISVLKKWPHIKD